MFGVSPLLPAYGRDYKSKAAIIKDFNGGKDFVCSNGQYANRDDIIALKLRSVAVRYANKRKSTILYIGADGNAS